MLFVMLALLCFLNYDKSEKARWLVLCGAAVGIVFVFKQNVGLLLLASATAAVVIREGMAFPRRSGGLGATRRTLIFWLGFTMIAAALLIYLAYLGSLRGMLDHFTSLAGDYSEKRAVPLPHIKLLAPVVVGLSAVCAIGVILVRRAPKLFEPFIVLTIAVVAAVLLVPHRAFVIKNSATAAISYLPLVMFILVLASAAWAFGKHRRSLEQREGWWRSFGPIAVVALFAFGAYLEVYPRADYAHLVRTLPPTFLLLLLAAKKGAPALTSWLRDRLQSPRRAAMLCVAAPLALLFIVGIKDTWQPRFDSSFRFVEQTPLRIERARGILVGRKQAEFIENLAAVIEGHSSVDDFIFSFAPRGTAFYFLSSRRNPTRLVWWRSAGIKKEDRDALADQIAAGIPKLLLVPDGFRNDRILDQVSARYHRIDFIGDIAIYERN
jgi:multisubunit Na+/H+ antiporter MnhC subunit